MTDEIKTGGLTFPFNDIGGDCDPGMTLHDYFSAKAMAAIISNPQLIDDLGERSVGWIVGHSRAVADAMIKARG